MLKEESMTQYLPGNLRKTIRALVSVAGVPAQIRNWHYPNKSVRAGLNQPVRSTEVNYCVYKLSPPETTLRQFHPFYILNTYFFKIHFNIIILPISMSLLFRVSE